MNKPYLEMIYWKCIKGEQFWENFRWKKKRLKIEKLRNLVYSYRGK